MASPVASMEKSWVTSNVSAVVVLGMHRSGTSALAGVLHSLGCSLPADLMGATEDNEKGYFESNAIRRFNDELLSSAGSSWSDWTGFNSAWLRSPVAEGFRLRARELVEKEFGRSHLFVLKDPRICRIVPFWHNVLINLDITPLYIHTHRNPDDVAASLHRRDGMPSGVAKVIWLRHMLDAEYATRGMRRCFVSYESLLHNWRQGIQEIQSRLDIVFPKTIRKASKIIDGFLSKDLRRFRHAEERLPDFEEFLNGDKIIQSIFDRWIVEENKADYERIDESRYALDQSVQFFEGLVGEAEALSKYALQSGAELAAAKHDNEKNVAALNDFASRLADAEESLLGMKADLEQCENERDSALRADSRLRDRINEKDKALTAAIESEAASRVTIEALRGQLADAEGELANARLALQKGELERQATQADQSALHARISRQDEALTSATDRERASEQAYDALCEQLLESERQLADTAKELLICREANQATAAAQNGLQEALHEKADALLKIEGEYQLSLRAQNVLRERIAQKENSLVEAVESEIAAKAIIVELENQIEVKNRTLRKQEFSILLSSKDIIHYEFELDKSQEKLKDIVEKYDDIVKQFLGMRDIYFSSLSELDRLKIVDQNQQSHIIKCEEKISNMSAELGQAESSLRQRQLESEQTFEELKNIRIMLDSERDAKIKLEENYMNLVDEYNAQKDFLEKLEFNYRSSSKIRFDEIAILSNQLAQRIADLKISTKQVESLKRQLLDG